MKGKRKEEKPKGALSEQRKQTPNPLANEQMWTDRGVWSKCLQATYGYQCGTNRCPLYHNGLEEI